MLSGRLRKADVGLLYDPSREAELSWAKAWQRALQKATPQWSIRRNYPYRGVSDGLTSHLRKRFPANAYAGLELEVNQRFPCGSARRWHELRTALCDTLTRVLCEEPQKVP